jgi:pimeloyl-ACP methyl ester carboxylesterase
MECQLENATVHYEILGAGRPLVVVHGAAGDHRVAAATIEPLFNQRVGWKRIYPDLPGHGATPGPAWMQNEDQLLDLLLSFIDRVIPHERFTLAGFSRGGYYARGILHRRLAQVAGLLLVAPLIQREERDLPQRTVLVSDQAVLAEQDEWTRTVAEAVLVVQDRATLKRVQALRPLFEDAKQDHAFHDRLKRSFSFPIDQLPQPFREPALFLLGRQDHVVGYRDTWKIVEHFPRATYAVLDQAGHAPDVEQLHLSQALISEWLDRVEARLISGQLEQL